jgi:hypothetical protein
VVQTFDLKGDREIGETTVNVINVGTGAAGISNANTGAGVLTQLFVSAAGYPVWQSYTGSDAPPYNTIDTLEADTGSGPYVLDTGQHAPSSTPVLGNLAVNGETVTWTHSGVSMSATLHSPTG